MPRRGLLAAVLVRCRGLCGRNTVGCATGDDFDDGTPSRRPQGHFGGLHGRGIRDQGPAHACDHTLQQLAQEANSLPVILLLLDEAGGQVLWSNRDLDFQMLSCSPSESGGAPPSPLHFLQELLGGQYSIDTVLQTVQASGTWSNSVRSMMADALVELQCNPYAIPGDFVNPLVNASHSSAVSCVKHDAAAVISVSEAARQYTAEPTAGPGSTTYNDFSWTDASIGSGLQPVSLPSLGNDPGLAAPLPALPTLNSGPDPAKQQTQLQSEDDESDTHSPPRHQASSKVTFAGQDTEPLGTAFTAQSERTVPKAAVPNPARSSLRTAANGATGHGAISYAGLTESTDGASSDMEASAAGQASFQLPGAIPDSYADAVQGSIPGSQNPEPQQPLQLPTLALPSLGSQRLSFDSCVGATEDRGSAPHRRHQSMTGQSPSRQHKSVSYPAAGPEQWRSSNNLSMEAKRRTKSLSEETHNRGRAVCRSISTRSVGARTRKNSLQRSLSVSLLVQKQQSVGHTSRENSGNGAAQTAMDDLQAAASRYQLGPKTAVLLQSLNRRHLSVGSDDKPHSSSASSRRGSWTPASSVNGAQEWKNIPRHASMDIPSTEARQISSSFSTAPPTRTAVSHSTPMASHTPVGMSHSAVSVPQDDINTAAELITGEEPAQAELETTQPLVPEQPQAEQTASEAGQGESETGAAHDEVEVPLRVAEVTVRMVPASSGSRSMLLVSCNDISARAALEAMLSQLMESQMAMVGSMFPYHVIEQLCKPPAQDPAAAGTGPAQFRPEALSNMTSSLDRLAKRHVDVTVLFMDIVGFTCMSKEVEPHQVMAFLNTLFSYFDELASIHGVHKVDTAGDCYIASAGLLEEGPDGFLHVSENHDPAVSAARMMAFAKDMLKFAQSVVMPHNQKPTNIRIGMHTGSCMSGLLGSKVPKFSIYGDSINTASRMESTSKPGHIQVSATTHLLLPQEQWEATGGVEVKGKGTMLTYLWVPPTTTTEQAPQLKMKGRVSSVSFFSMLGGLQPQPAQPSTSIVQSSLWELDSAAGTATSAGTSMVMPPRLLNKQMTPPHELPRSGSSRPRAPGGKSRRWSVDMSMASAAYVRAQSLGMDETSQADSYGAPTNGFPVAPSCPALNRMAAGPWQLLKPNGTAGTARPSAVVLNRPLPRLSLGPLATGLAPLAAVPGFVSMVAQPQRAGASSAAFTDNEQQAWAPKPPVRVKPALPPSLFPEA